MAHKILVIDDDEDLTAVVEVGLTDRNYEVYTANDGTAGLEKARECRPDLIVLDMIMPSLNGYEFMRAYNARRIIDKQPEIPVIIVTAKEEMRKTLESQGVKEYLVKPIEFSYLIEKIENYLGPNANG